MMQILFELEWLSVKATQALALTFNVFIVGHWMVCWTGPSPLCIKVPVRGICNPGFVTRPTLPHEQKQPEMYTKGIAWITFKAHTEDHRIPPQPLKLPIQRRFV